MCIAWGLLLPVGILIARFGKTWGPIWFHLHRILNMTGLTVAFAAWIIAITKIAPGVTAAHYNIGMIVMSLALFQPINAAIRPHPPAKGEAISTKRFIWNLLHHWTGRVAYVLAVINVFIGFGILLPPQSYYTGFCVIWGGVMVVGGCTQIYFWIKPATADSTPAPKQIAMTETNGSNGIAGSNGATV